MVLVARRHGIETIKLHSMNANMLKLVAIAAMIIQHFTVEFMDRDEVLYYPMISIGKITAPVMCFFIAEGFHYSHDRLKYLKRLFLFALLSHVPHALAFGFPIWAFWRYTSVMWSLTLGLAALMIYDQKKWSRLLRGVGILACCILAFPGNWNCVAVIWILGFGIFRDEPVKKWSMFLLGIFIHILEVLIMNSDECLISNLALILPVILLSCYNGKRGKKNVFIQGFFYWFYPVHLLIIYTIRLFT